MAANVMRSNPQEAYGNSTEIPQQRPLYEMRASSWFKPGDDAKGRPERPVYLDLGNIDPVEKNCRDEVLNMMLASANAKVVVPDAQILARLQDCIDTGGGASPLPNKPTTSERTAEPTSSNAWVNRGGRSAADRLGASSPTPESPRPWNASSGTGSGQIGKGQPQPGDIALKTLRVSNLITDISENELGRIFSQPWIGGEVIGIYIPRNPDGEPRGFGFVHFSTVKSAAQGLKLDGQRFKNVVLRVCYGTVRTQRGRGRR